MGHDCISDGYVGSLLTLLPRQAREDCVAVDDVRVAAEVVVAEAQRAVSVQIAHQGGGLELEYEF